MPSSLRVARAATLCVALAAACHAPTPRAPSYQQREIELEQGFLHVTLKIPQTPRGRKPAVIGPLGDEAQLLALGVVIVDYRQDWSALPVHAFEPQPKPPPDETKHVGRWLLAAPRPGIVGRAYFQLIAGTAHNTIPALVDLLVTVPEVDPDRIAIAGSSTNGFIALEALVDEPRLAAGVARVTCGDYRTFLRSSELALNDDPRWLPDGKLVLDPDYEAELDAQEPILHADALPPRPLLLMAGTADRAVPFACAERTAKRFAAAYERAGVPERFHFVIFEDRGHALGPEAVTQALAFWQRWLIGPRAGAAQRR